MKLLFALLLASSITACGKKYEPYPMPHTLYFIIKHNGVHLSDNTLDSMRLSYYINNSKKYVLDFTRATNEDGIPARELGVQLTREVGNISGEQGIKNFYLEYPNGDVDTLYVDYQHLSDRAGAKDPCGCLYPFKGILFNDVEPGLASDIPDVKIYQLNKR